MREQFKDFTFNAEKQSIIDQCNGYIVRTRRQGYMVTLRQVYYFTISSDCLPETWIDREYNLKNGLDPETKNTMKNYKRLGALLADARLAGIIDWSSMEDRTRGLESVNHWNSPAEIIAACAAQYRIDKWATQPRHVEVWVEKDALIGVLEKVCREMDVAWYSCRGYASLSELYEAGKRLRRYKDDDKEPVIIYLGDHDPSGIDMTRDVLDRVSMFGRSDFEVKRIALTRQQIVEVQAPPNPAKLTDSRADKYVREHGTDSWELDALPIEYIDRIVRETVLTYRNEPLWRKAVAEEERQRKFMAKAAEQWPAIENLLNEQE